jgi:prophage antirepressor-like protein
VQSTDIIPFTFEEVSVRTILMDGEPWWLAGDVARALGYRDAGNLTRRLDDDEKGTHVLSTPGGPQRVAIINEPGLWNAILRSDSPRAATFKRWITHKVLPEIRRTGAFGQPADLAMPGTYLEALEALVTRERANLALEQENAQLTPRAVAWDAIASAEGDYSVGEAAKMLARAGIPNMGPQRLFQKLADIRWTYRTGSNAWAPYADRVEKGYLAVKPQFHYHQGTGAKVIDDPQLRVTLKGVERLRLRLAGNGANLRAVTA